MNTLARGDKLSASRGVGAHDQAWEAELRACLNRRTGIVVQPHQNAALNAAAARACHRFGLSDGADVVRHLRDAEDGSPLFDLIIDQITVQESFFFRDPRQIQALREQILPALIQRKTRQGHLSLRFWSAGCSLGQEIYTLAILLEEMLKPSEPWRVHLLGTDINPIAVAGAGKGLYSKWSLRSTPKSIIKRFFTETAGDYEIIPAIKTHAHFKIMNLSNTSNWDGANDTRDLDLILCRNVFIYLDQPTIAGVLERFSCCLVSGGSLLLGASDFIQHLPPNLTLHRYGEVQCLDKRAPEHAVAGSPSTLAPMANPIPPTPANHHARKTAPKPRTSRKSRAKTAKTKLENADLAQLAECFESADWNTLAAQSNTLMQAHCDDPGAWIWCGLAHANLGGRETAIQCFEQALSLDQGTWLAHLGLGLVFCDADRLLEAEEVLKNARYLHPERPEAHYHLAVVRRLMGRKREARHSFGTALELARQLDPQAHLLHLPQTCFADLISGLEAELSALND